MRHAKRLMVIAVALYGVAAVAMAAGPRTVRWLDRAQSRPAVAAAATLQAADSAVTQEQLDALARRLLRGAEIARTQRSVMRGYPQAESYFTGRAEAFTEAAEVVLEMSAAPQPSAEGGVR
jgi:hypothetical protein